MRALRQSLSILIFLCLLVLCCFGNAYGEKLVFDFENITRVELEIALFDLKVNQLNEWNIKQEHPIFHSVGTCTWGKSQIHINVFVRDTLLRDPIGKRKEQIAGLFQVLFEMAKAHFWLKIESHPYPKKCFNCLTTGHVNMNMHLYSDKVITGMGEVIAEWRGGKVLYTDAFLKQVTKGN